MVLFLVLFNKSALKRANLDFFIDNISFISLKVCTFVRFLE